MSKTNTLEGIVLDLSPLEPSDTILVSGLNETTPNVLLKFILTDCIKENDSVKSVTRLSHSQALVLFTSYISMYISLHLLYLIF